MKVFSLLEPHTLGLLDLMVESLGIDREKFDHEMHPQEDFLLTSEKHPIFAVADGVTLEADQNGQYPNPSGAGSVAEIFCKEAVKEAEKQFDDFSEDTMREIFRAGNKAVYAYNTEQGRSKETSNFFDFDLFAATAAVAVVKSGIIYWGTICDSYVALYDAHAVRRFRSPACWNSPRITQHTDEEWSVLSEIEQRKEIRRVYRNGVDRDGNPIGYGVITGEEEAMKYVRFGSEETKMGDTALIYTDGFEEYIKLPEFLRLFYEWSDDLEDNTKAFTKEKAQENIPNFGRERSLIAVRVE